MRNSAATYGNGVRAEQAFGAVPAGASAGPPASIRRIIIVGAGGFGREVLNWTRDAWPSAAEKIAGFLAADIDPRHADRCLPPIMGNPHDYLPQAGDAFLLAIGIAGVRRRVAEALAARGAAFLTLIHPTAIVAPTASIGVGSILCPYAIVSDSVRLGRFTLMNYHCSLGHDAKTGDFTVLSPYATLGGAAELNADCFLGLHASVAPGKRLGARTKVSANSAALSDTPADSLVYGVPGRVVPNLATPTVGG